MTETSPAGGSALDLVIGGMTCASCAMRIEKKLNRMPGVTATVNYATEKAHLVLPEGVPVEDAIATVEATGYTARVPDPPNAPITSFGDADREGARDPELDSLRQRLVISTALTVPVVAMAMIPALQFEYWQWASLTLAAPVVVWGAWPFHRAAVDQPAPRRGDDGHPDQRGGQRGVPVVAVGVVPRRGRDAGDDDELQPDAHGR